MPGGGGAIGGSNNVFASPTPAPSPTALFGNPQTFTSAANTQASDYDRIMQQYADLAKSYSNNPITAAPVTAPLVTPTTSTYTQSPDVTGSLSNLSNLATTGGYSGSDIANIRARAVSPTRSIYSSAQQNVERQKALAGGYSPNFGAVQAQMARDESQQISDADTNAEAAIAQNVASNKIAAASPYASASASANAAQTQADQANSAIVNQINEANANAQTQANEFNTQAQLAAAQANRTGTTGAISGQANLYGTTPALTNTFGNQVVQATQLGQGQQNLNTQKYNAFGRLDNSFG